ncbi:D-lyxose/D-mannose family sugar isomerase [Paucilactobacillus kaifaensis]|uniref:D-lyxose/D-mannose family sugar isomerase n=1 Tax=Paucilactobacillus kaifaensis TaxID=2559921 RepID=UPI0010F7F8B0|nr:D-lyxose/D-mannose family sugar isomerase [Paucilactobacillus kaifaensis]
MKRSEINQIIDKTIEFADDRGLFLPPFAYWNQADWQKIDSSYDEILDNMLGWDVTDFNEDNYYQRGLATFTFRNGNFNDKEKYPKPYCEKLLTVEDGQELPFHFHWYKEEDIINRGGGVLELTLYKATADEELDTKSPVTVVMDGHRVSVAAGATVELQPGQSITLTQRIYHRWRGKKGTGKIMLFEVSSTNDDNTDNRFFENLPRIPLIEEDVVPEHLIFADYEKLRK